MKRFTHLALLLCIVLMCADPTGVQGQARRSGGHGSQGHGGASHSGHQSSHSVSPRTKSGPSGATYHAATRSNNAPGHGNVASRQSISRGHASRPSGGTAMRSSTPAHRPAAVHNGGTVRHNGPAMHNAPAHRSAAVHRPAPAHRPAPVVHRPAPRPAPAYHPHHHGYSFGARFRGLPPHARLYHYAGLDYYYYDGIYYRHHPYGGYYICRPPLGAIFARDVLDAVITAVVFKTALNAVSNCYYSDGVYYQRVNDQYNVIEAPVGALITQLPSDYQEVIIGGETYYKVDETLYRVTVYDGQSYFEVVTSI